MIRLFIHFIIMLCFPIQRFCHGRQKQATVTRIEDTEFVYEWRYESSTKTLREMKAEIPLESIYCRTQYQYCNYLTTKTMFFHSKQEEFVVISENIMEELYIFYPHLFKYHYEKRKNPIQTSNTKCYALPKFFKNIFKRPEKKREHSRRRKFSISDFEFKCRFLPVNVNIMGKRLLDLAMPCLVRVKRTGELKQYYVSRRYGKNKQFRFLFRHDSKNYQVGVVVHAIITEWFMNKITYWDANKMYIPRDYEIRKHVELNPTCKLKPIAQIILCQIFSQILPHVSQYSPKFYPSEFNIRSCRNRTVFDHYPLYNPVTNYPPQRHDKYYSDLVIECQSRNKNKRHSFYFSLLPKRHNFYSLYTNVISGSLKNNREPILNTEILYKNEKSFTDHEFKATWFTN